MNAAGSWLERITIDWTAFSEASFRSTEIVQCLAGDRALLRRMVLAAESDDALRPLAEKHGELSYVVLHDALDRGLRVRVHWFHKGQEDLPHDHRYSFSSALLSGSYVHALFALDDAAAAARRRQLPGGGPDAPRERWPLDQPEGTSAGVTLHELDVLDQTPVLRTVQRAGSSYTLHHSSIHNISMPDEDAFSVFCRGPVVKPWALQLNPERRTYRWKLGRQHESRQVLERRRMTSDDFRAFVEALEAAGVIP